MAVHRLAAMDSNRVRRSQMKVSLKQRATYIGDDRWKWSVWVDGDKADLAQIDFVEYVLHPTFSPPIRRVDHRGSKFRLDSAAWGEFRIRALIATKDGHTKRISHWLELRYPTEGKAQAQKKEETESTESEDTRQAFFLSCNIADSLFANALSKALIARGARVLMVTDEPSDLPWEASIRRLLDQADFAVFIISDALSIWLKRDIEATNEHGIPIIPVIIV